MVSNLPFPQSVISPSGQRALSTLNFLAGLLQRYFSLHYSSPSYPAPLFRSLLFLPFPLSC
jgi:hypothetical protein